MATICEMRRMRNALSDRFERILTAANAIIGTKSVFTAQMYENKSNWNWDDDDEGKDEELKQLIGTEIPVFSPEFLFSLIGTSSHYHYMVEIQTFASTNKTPYIDDEFLHEEPSFAGFTKEEIGFISAKYKRKINHATRSMRDINTHCKYLNGIYSPLPGFLKKTLGLDGGGDLFKNPNYNEGDFKHQRYTSPERERQKFLSQLWLVPIIGPSNTNIILDSIKIIAETSNPLAGEPPTLDWYSSNKSNAYDAFANLGESHV